MKPAQASRQRFSTGIRHGNQHILPPHRLLLNIANAQKVPVSRCSLETAEHSLTFGVMPKQVQAECSAVVNGASDPFGGDQPDAFDELVLASRPQYLRQFAQVLFCYARVG